MYRRAVILAGGLGTRLRPYTVILPKPLMPLGKYPILEIIIRQLVAAKFDHITLAVNHQAEIIQAFFQDGSRWGIKIDYSLEDRPLGTMGPLSRIKDLPDNFLVMNGDILTDLNFKNFFESHIANKNILTISSKRRHQRVDYGVLESAASGVLTGFREKPAYDFEVSMGIYMLSKDVVNIIPPESFYGFDSLILEMLSKEMVVNIQAFDGYWLDIGRPDDYATAIDEFDKLEQHFLNE